MKMMIGVIDMEDDKVADMVLMIPNEDFSGGTVAIGDTQWDDVRGNDGLDMEVDKMVQSGATSGGHIGPLSLWWRIWWWIWWQI